MKMNTKELERKVVELIDYRINAIVPNVSWGLGLNHECDLLYLDDKNRFTEIELKISKQDFLNDFKKPHGHSSRFISRLIYAVPEELEELALSKLSGTKFGLIVAYNDSHIAKWIKIVKHDKSKESPTPKTINKFLRLGTIRIWSNNRS